MVVPYDVGRVAVDGGIAAAVIGVLVGHRKQIAAGNFENSVTRRAGTVAGENRPGIKPGADSRECDEFFIAPARFDRHVRHVGRDQIEIPHRDGNGVARGVTAGIEHNPAGIAGQEVVDPISEHRGSGVNAVGVGPGAAVTPTDDPGVEIAASAVVDHQRPAAVSMTGAPSPAGKPGRQHVFGHQPGVTRRGVGHLVRHDRHADLLERIGRAAAFDQPPPADDRRHHARREQRLLLRTGESDRRLSRRLGESNQRDVEVDRHVVVVGVNDDLRDRDPLAYVGRQIVSSQHDVEIAGVRSDGAVCRGQDHVRGDQRSAAEMKRTVLERGHPRPVVRRGLVSADDLSRPRGERSRPGPAREQRPQIVQVDRRIVGVDQIAPACACRRIPVGKQQGQVVEIDVAVAGQVARRVCRQQPPVFERFERQRTSPRIRARELVCMHRARHRCGSRFDAPCPASAPSTRILTGDAARPSDFRQSPAATAPLVSGNYSIADGGMSKPGLTVAR